MGKVIGILGGAVVLVIVLLGAMIAALTSAVSTSAATPSATALADIPGNYLALYQQAAGVCPHLDWTVLAAIGKVETNHGRSTLSGVSAGQNSAGAGGPMQFLESTFESVDSRHPLPRTASGKPSRYDPQDAIYAAAYYLCDSGADHGDLHSAIFAYNHAEWYVHKVQTQATIYANSTPTQTGTGTCTTIQAANPAVTAVINFACGQRGLPYTWGGSGPKHGDKGFDCSGLTQSAYAAAGINLPRTAQTQYNTGPHIPSGQPLQPGDLIFFGTPSNVHHVGLYIGQSEMVDAPDFGQSVKIEKYQEKDYLSATRPQ